MLSFLKKLFGAKPTVDSPAPYKIEKPETTVATVPMSTQYTQPTVEEPAKKKPAAKKATGAKKPAVRAKSVKAKKQ